MMQLSIVHMPAISVIYYGLLNSGYDFYHIGRDEQHTAALQHFVTGTEASAFFAQTRQNTCEVYPYWPRAALMETSSFYLADDLSAWKMRDELHQHIMNAANIADHERDAAFWAWLDEFPSSLAQVMEREDFRRYQAWEQAWIREQNRQYAGELHRIAASLHVCREKYLSTVRDIRIVLSPIKCIYSADYHLVDDCFIFSSGRFSMASILHEFLHHVVHPVVAAHQHEILLHPQAYPEIDRSYHSAGQLNAFEEYMVRQLTQAAMANQLPDDLHQYLHQLLSW